MMNSSSRYAAAAKASGIHLLASSGIALLAAVVVFLVWFPYPYRELVGGQFLFWVLVGVDVVCGPLLTAVLYNPAKSRRELALDLSLVAVVQLGALLYGMHSISLARPVAVVYEVDRFVVVTAAEIAPDALAQAQPAYRHLPWLGGPWLLGVRPPRDSEEAQHNLSLSLQGSEPSTRPGWWQPYASSRASAQARMQPLPALHQRLLSPGQRALDVAVQKTGIAIGQLHYLPLVSHKAMDDWIALLDAQAGIVGYAPVGGWGE